MRIKHILLLVPLSIVGNLAYGEDLLSAYQKTVLNSDTYKARKMSAASKNAQERKSLSAFLPHISANAAYGRASTKTVIDKQLSYFPNMPKTSKDIDNTYDLSASLVQSLFDYASWKKFKTASILKKAAQLKQADEKQSIGFDVSQNYFSILKQMNELDYLALEKHGLMNDKQRATNKLKVGTGTKLAIDEVDLKLQDITTQEMLAQNNISLGLKKLSIDESSPVTSITPLKKEVNIALPAPDSLKTWTERADANNIGLQAEQDKLNAARDAIGIAKATHYPKVFAALSYNTGKTQLPVFKRAAVTQKSAYVGVHVPIFAGGENFAETSKAEDNYWQYHYEYLNAVEEVNKGVDQVFLDIVMLHQKIANDKMALAVANEALASVERSYKAGFKDIEDVITFRNKVFDAQIAYNNDIIDYITLKLKLLQLSGNLHEKDIANANDYLQTQ